MQKKIHIIWLYLFTLVINTLGAMGVINGMSQKAVSDAYPTLITPSPVCVCICRVMRSSW